MEAESEIGIERVALFVCLHVQSSERLVSGDSIHHCSHCKRNFCCGLDSIGRPWLRLLLSGRKQSIACLRGEEDRMREQWKDTRGRGFRTGAAAKHDRPGKRNPRPRRTHKTRSGYVPQEFHSLVERFRKRHTWERIHPSAPFDCRTVPGFCWSSAHTHATDMGADCLVRANLRWHCPHLTSTEPVMCVCWAVALSHVSQFDDVDERTGSERVSQAGQTDHGFCQIRPSTRHGREPYLT